MPIELPRPSDAVNLAVLSGAPIRVDAAILDDPVVDSHPGRVPRPRRLLRPPDALVNQLLDAVFALT